MSLCLSMILCHFERFVFLAVLESVNNKLEKFGGGGWRARGWIVGLLFIREKGRHSGISWVVIERLAG